MTSIRAVLVVSLLFLLHDVALAKLPPAPPMTDAQKQEVAAKKAASDAKDAAELAHAQDRAVQNYAATERAKGVQVSPPGMSAGGSPGVSTGGTNAGGVATKPPSTKATPEKAMAHSPPTKQH